ncbi:hypothetical protein CAPTEDRAFT_188643 [Capitella teleta]|uniref:SH3 domain-binding protein 5-like n=1 Tax=Capitella teleta TaxID=283909 RepID=R7V7W1_CAPTE|nr:hypothetical protein CAPTEDRAFT_188643 [Capitella teleta]|eukprot:ELU11835.1 hypothetical protein CAPTEDRAFT_188643 [Capitella teleta]
MEGSSNRRDSSEFSDELLDPRIQNSTLNLYRDLAQILGRVQYNLFPIFIQSELEKLNTTTETINSLEQLLERARARFRQHLTDSTHQLKEEMKKIGTAVEKARPYYEARMKAQEAQAETQAAAQRFERACSQLSAAKEMVFLAEQGFFGKNQAFEPAWQEMLNHSTMKVNDAEQDRLESEVEHKRTAFIFNEAENNVQRLHKQLRRSISKSKPYFEKKATFIQQMEEQKEIVSSLEERVSSAKETYAKTLKNLEAISDSVHQQRHEAKMRHELGSRGSGVGTETPDPPPSHDIIITDAPEEEPVKGDDLPGKSSELTIRSNAEVMKDLQAKKGERFLMPLRKRSSQEDLIDETDHDSHSSSLASASVLDDDQIQSLMLETPNHEYSKFISRNTDNDKYKRMSLPIRLSYLENYMNFKPLFDDEDGEKKESVEF